MRTMFIGTLAILFGTVSVAHAARYSSTGKVSKITVLKNGTLEVRLSYQDANCTQPFSAGHNDTPRLLSLLMQAALTDTAVRVTADTAGNGRCNIAAVELFQP